MESVYDYITLISFILSALFLLLSVGLFFGLHIRQVWRELNGSMAVNLNGTLVQRQMAEIRLQNQKFNQKKKINIFDEVENWTGEMEDPGQMATTAFDRRSGEGKKAGTALLRRSYSGTVMLGRKKENRDEFVVEKDISFVATERSL